MSALILAVVAIAAATWVSARMRTLDSLPVVTSDGDDPQLSLIVPARNEAENLPLLLRSIAASTLRPAEVIVIDDESSDATAEVAAAFGATVVSSPPKPSDWSGKTWACQIGAAVAHGSMLAFVDADVRLGPSALQRCCDAVSQTGGLVSVEPYHVTERPYEQLSAFFNAASALGSGAFAASRGTSRRRVAFGPLIVTRRDQFEEVDGFSQVKGSVIEDIELAQVYRAHGIPVSCWLGGPLVAFRMYATGLRSLVEGWTKNIALGARAADRAAVTLAVIWVASLAAVATSLVIGLVDWSGGDRPPVLELAAYVAVAVHASWLFRHLGSFSVITAALYPIPLAFFLGVFLRSAVGVILHRPVTWKGRSLSTDAGSSP